MPKTDSIGQERSRVTPPTHVITGAGKSSNRNHCNPSSGRPIRAAALHLYAFHLGGGIGPSFQRTQQKTYKAMNEITITKPTLLKGIMGAIERYFYTRKADKRRAEYSAIYRELIAERDAKGLIVKN